MPTTISLLPLDPALHTAALQAVYAATPAYWALYDLARLYPPDQAARDLAALARRRRGRALLGIVQPADPVCSRMTGAELVGVVDFRRHWPAEGVAYIGMLMVAQPLQRRGIGRQTWQLLRPWLAGAAAMTKVRLGVEQFNHTALKFWTSLGFTLTGESDRLKAGEKFVRLLYLELDLHPTAPERPR
jgi:RimJ/RimL family protein N-acetyltransferase